MSEVCIIHVHELNYEIWLVSSCFMWIMTCESWQVLLVCRICFSETPDFTYSLYSKTCLQGTLRQGDTLWSGDTFLKQCPIFPHVKEPVMKGHLSCRDTFSWILRCPLKTGFTVYPSNVSVLGGGGDYVIVYHE